LTTVTAGVYGTLDTTGLGAGWYQVYAIDSYGNVSAGSNAMAIISPTVATVEDDTVTVQYSGTWTRFVNMAYSGGSVERAESAGAYADIPFYGTSAKLFGSRSVNNGQARIYIDGIYQTTIDTYSPTTQYQQELYDTGALSEGAHVLRVEAAWTRHSSANNYYVTFDRLEAFLVE
ncbi:MAG: hypothetical protein K0Q73_8710, partial [Paenibacillus sp.]|nr:hypothetical protein [Paenibacillus sp.]